MKRLLHSSAAAFDQRPLQFLLVVLLAQLVLWSLAPALTFRSAPLDVMENIGWGQTWQLGYYKHPPLQVWLTTSVVALGGGAVWPVYVLAQIAVLLTYIPLFLLGREAGNAKVGLLAVLIFSLVYYANWPTPEFNTNVLQMPIWALAVLALWRAANTGRLIWWMSLGIAAAAAVYAKYSAVILFAALILASLLVPVCRRAYRTPGPYLAGAIAFVLIAPHVVWLWQSDFLPIRYVESRASHLQGVSRLLVPLHFMGAQALDFLLPAIMLLSGGIATRASWSGDREDVTEPGIRRFVLLMAIAPYAFTLLFSLLFGLGLRDMWGAPMATWISLAIVTQFGVPTKRLAEMILVWGLAFIVMPLGLAAASIVGRGVHKPPRAAWPSPALESKLVAVWDANTGAAPLRIVAGDTWATGILTTYAASHPMVLTEADYKLSPWITPDSVKRMGALLVWSGPLPGGPPGRYLRLGTPAATGTVSVPFSDSPSAANAEIGWAILSPG